MRYLIIVVLITLMSGCSWWPWGAEKTGSCLDNDSCDSSNPLEEKLIGGTWHCYGVDKNEPWDCSQQEDPSKIVSITEKPIVRASEETALQSRAEITFEREFISNQLEEMDADTATTAPETAPMPAPMPASMSSPSPEKAPIAADAPNPDKQGLFSYSDRAWAIQLIALQTEEEVKSFVADHSLDQPSSIRIRSQGSDWFVLILGVYDDREEANQAAQSWADRYQPSSKPWVRPLGPLKRAALEVTPVEATAVDTDTTSN